MDVSGWSQVGVAALGGGLTVKILDIAYQEVRAQFTRKQSARKLVDDHLDPILKAADELVGKLRSLAEEDFASLCHRSVQPRPAIGSDNKVLVFLYLFASFWARIELLKRDAIAVNMQEHPKGKLLKQFLDCIESRRVRLLDRGTQRAIGEVLIDRDKAPSSTMYFIEFAERMEDPKIWRWYTPLYAIATRLNHTYERQRVLQYGAVLHALVDTLDRRHHVTGKRPGWPNKLTKRTARDLQFRVFGRYLGFVREQRKYAITRK